MDYPKRLVLVVMLISAPGTLQRSGKGPELVDKQATALERVTKQFESARRARYMEQDCKGTMYQGWEKFPLKECVYTVNASSGPMKTKVILLDPTPGQLARWVVSTCATVKSGADTACTDLLVHRIVSQSGAQFAVAGIVLEDMQAPALFKAYAFRNGVTVQVDGFRNGLTVEPSEAWVEASLHGKITFIGKYARIQGTTVDEYKNNCGTEDVGVTEKPTEAWLQVVMKSYQQAWNSDNNDLMIAWARENVPGASLVVCKK
jgi:hypothetical protein